MKQFKEIKENGVNFTFLKNFQISFIQALIRQKDVFGSFNEIMFFLKDISNDEATKKELLDFKDYSIIHKDLYKKFYEDKAKELEDRMEGYFLLLQGLCGMFDRYNKFVCVFDVVEQNYRHSINNRDGDVTKRSREYEAFKVLKEKFEITMLEEIDTFKYKYKSVFSNIIQDYHTMLKEINQLVK